jgi:chitinase
LLLAAFVNSISTKEYVRGCYYTNWSQYRSEIWKFMPENIESGLCSHIFYAFASMGDDFKLKHVEANDVDGNGTAGLYSQVNSLKANQTDLKTLLSFGGYLFSQSNGPLMRKMLESVDNRKVFIDSAIAFVRLHKFDGFDFNWFPEADTKDGFVKLVKEFREAIDAEAKVGDLPRLLLTAGVPPQVNRIEAGYDGKALAESLDWMNVMAFDYHGSWENKTGFNTPMFDRDGDGISINSTFAHLIEKQEIPKDKLVMGLATYGRGWTLPSTSLPNSIPSPAEGPSPAQPFTLAEGTAAYFEICKLIEKDNFTESFDDVQKCPFIFKDGVWIGYDNQRSYEEELSWLIEKDLRGAFVWALDMDDFNGHCSSSNGTYPLVKTVRSKLVKE